MIVNIGDIASLNNSKYIVIYNLSSTEECRMIINHKEKILKPDNSIKKLYHQEKLDINFPDKISIKLLHISNSCLVLTNYNNETMEKISFSILTCIIPSNPEYISILDFKEKDKIYKPISNYTIVDITNILWENNKPSQRKKIKEHIPLIIHFVWLLKDNQNKFQKRFLNNISTWHKYNQKCNLILWTDCDIEVDNEEFPFIKVKNKNKINNILKKVSKNHTLEDLIKIYESIPNVCNRSNILRYCILYLYGGLYVDINDFICIRSHEQILEKYSFIVSPEPSYHFLNEENILNSELYLWNNALIGTIKQHDIILKLIEVSCSNYRTNEIPKSIEQKCTIAEADKYVYSITGGIIFRNIINGYLLDPFSNKKNLGILPPYFFYPSVSYELPNGDNTNVSYSQLKDKIYWDNRETLSIHSNENTYIN